MTWLTGARRRRICDTRLRQVPLQAQGCGCNLAAPYPVLPTALQAGEDITVQVALVAIAPAVFVFGDVNVGAARKGESTNAAIYGFVLWTFSSS